MNIFKKLSLSVLSGFLMTSTAFAELPQISDARVVQPPPGAKVAAAYFTIHNPTTEPLVITGAQSTISKHVEVHLSSVENDVAKMEEQESVTVEAGESLQFKHGSYHIMFMGLNDQLNAGDSLELTLNTSAGELDVTVPIISLDESTSMGDMQHDMKDMQHDMKDMKHDMKDMKHNMKGMKHDMKSDMHGETKQ